MEITANGAERLFGIELTEEKLTKLAAYKDLVLEWNEKINLTAITSEEEFAVKHILDSLSLLTVCDFNGARVIDVGTGGGFPGIPLAICSSGEFVLIDSLNKRVRFLNEAIRALGLDNVTAIHIRAEDAGRDEKFRGGFDYAVSRAIAPLPVLSEFCLPLVCVGGMMIAMKGNNYAEETASAKRAIHTLGGREAEIKLIDLPPDISHSLIMTKKVRPTPSIYPRTYAIMTKKPL